MTVEPSDIMPYLWMGGRRAPGEALSERIAVLLVEAMAAVRPARTWMRMAVPRRWLDESRALSMRIAGCRDAYLACGTVGAAFDAYHRRVSVASGADALIVQAIGAAAIEKVMDSIEDDIRGELAPGETLVSRFSPGYGDFPLAEQRVLLGLLDASRRVGVSLTDAMLMVPSKSVSAVIGVRPAVSGSRPVDSKGAIR